MPTHLARSGRAAPPDPSSEHVYSPPSLSSYLLAWNPQLSSPARPPTGGQTGDVQGTAGKSLRSDGRPAATLNHFRATPTHLPTVRNTNTNCDDAEIPNSFALERQERNLTVGGLRIRRANAATDGGFVRHPPDSSACAAPAMQLQGSVPLAFVPGLDADRHQGREHRAEQARQPSEHADRGVHGATRRERTPSTRNQVAL